MYYFAFLNIFVQKLIDSQVYSMEEDLKMEPDLKMATSPDDMLKFLDDIPDSVTSASPQPVSRDVNEKMAINAIQRQLMSFEVPGSNMVPRNNLRFQQPVTMAMMPQNPVVHYSQANQYQTGAPPAYTLSNQRTRAPGIHGVQNNINMVPSAPQINNRQTLPQYGGLQNLNDLSPQVSLIFYYFLFIGELKNMALATAKKFYKYFQATCALFFTHK